ncbi:hypothetical protein B0J11DRAFT_82652 [Dendryphion nanum]|uniref:Uncharacterized protein n=1 Tax=Dendryphion nanum TaxID=256645 RepID=A0A9P9DGY7_9PLEO|nr:hypothetical protein B0J11DRAFT_82652 [Dendryphion nanum]
MDPWGSILPIRVHSSYCHLSSASFIFSNQFPVILSLPRSLRTSTSTSFTSFTTTNIIIIINTTTTNTEISSSQLVQPPCATVRLPHPFSPITRASCPRSNCWQSWRNECTALHNPPTRPLIVVAPTLSTSIPGPKGDRRPCSVLRFQPPAPSRPLLPARFALLELPVPVDGRRDPLVILRLQEPLNRQPNLSSLSICAHCFGACWAGFLDILSSTGEPPSAWLVHKSPEHRRPSRCCCCLPVSLCFKLS